MMRHPFHGRGIPETEQNATFPARSAETGAVALRSRRTFVSQAFATLMGALAVFLGTRTSAQEPVEGAGTREKTRTPGTVTTQAIGEEGASTPPRRPGEYTTQALGEEGGASPPPRYTTYALGEEGAGYPRPSPPSRGRYTTFALGEEGGGYRYRYRRR